MLKLSNQQQAAINYKNSSVLVAAGAGSGKTRTLTAKFIQLVNSGFNPSKILAITFTNKAAIEMKTRLTSIIGIEEKKLSWVRTYHSACLKIIKHNFNLLGYKNPIQIYTKHHQQKLIETILEKLNINKKNGNYILKQISNAKNTGFPKEYLNYKCKLLNLPFIEIYNLYQQELTIKNALDYDNILLLTRNLLRDNIKIKLFYKNYFQYILCDEYQDTNNLNEEITKLLLKDNNFFAVGDDWQSVYSFRMSNINHFLSFHINYPKAKIFKLEKNYRSASKIVKLGNNLINTNKNIIKKKCYSKKQGGTIKICKFNSDYEESNWIIKKIKIINSTGIKYNKIAILYRTKFCSLLFEKQLRKNKIPYKISGGNSFFEKKEVLDLNSYLIAAIFEKDDISFKRILNTPKRRIGIRTIDKINDICNKKISLQKNIKEIIKEKKLPEKINNIIKKILNILKKIKNNKPNLALKKILTKTNYIKHTEKHTKSNSINLTSKIENIEYLIKYASQTNNIQKYLEETSLIEDNKNQLKTTNDDHIILSTIHSVKGLEFETVFITGCEEHIFPHWKSLKKNKDIEEERRLMYVAITRAKKHLFITYALLRKGLYNNKSRFINEITSNL